MKPQFSFTTSPSHGLGLAWILITHELKRNLISYLLPFPVLLGVFLINTFSSHPLKLGNTGVLSLIIGFAILAMTYGLQCFSSDSDKKTLDFIISRPITPALILMAKYGVSLFVLLTWYISFLGLCKVSLASLPLPKGIGMEWITLLILLIHSLGLLAGLLAKGLERFFVIITTTLLITAASYYIWNQIFLLITANYYWYDIPPYQLYFVQSVLPYYLAVISLTLPLVGALWYLRNRIPLAIFTPGKFTIGIWFFTLLLLGMAESIFSPVLWPNKTAQAADWHTTAGIIIASPIDPAYEFRHLHDDQKTLCRLYLSYPGHRSKIIYTGNNLVNPHFSPDGSRLLFSESGELKIMTMHTRKVTRLGLGRIGAWSKDGQQLIYARSIGPRGLSDLFLYNISKHTKRKLLPNASNIADLIWNSPKNQLYILDYARSIRVVDLKTLSETSYPFEDSDKLSIVFGLSNHFLGLDPSCKNLVLGYPLQDSLKICLFNLETKKFDLNEELVNYRLKPGAPFMIRSDLRALLWPRIDGTYAYQTTHFYTNLEHALAHHHEHEGEHPNN